MGFHLTMISTMRSLFLYVPYLSAFYGVVKGFFALNNRKKKVVNEVVDEELKTSYLY